MEIRLEEENKKYQITLTGNQLELLDYLIDAKKEKLDVEYRYDDEVRKKELSKLERISNKLYSAIVQKRYPNLYRRSMGQVK